MTNELSFDQISDKVNKVFAKRTTKFAARKGSTFLQFVFTRISSGDGLLAGYTKAGKVMTVPVTAFDMRQWVATSLSLRGQTFSYFIDLYSVDTVAVSPAAVLEIVYDMHKEVVLPAAKSSKSFSNFSIKAHSGVYKTLCNFSESRYELTATTKCGTRRISKEVSASTAAAFLGTPASNRGSQWSKSVEVN